MRLLGSVVLWAADQARVPGGTALAVDRDVFSAAVHERVTSHPRITVVREEVSELPSPGIVATGPLTSDALGRGDPVATRRRVARVLRLDRADRRARVDRRVGRVPRVAIRQGDDGRRRRRGRSVSQLSVHARAVRGVHRRARRGRPASRARVRRGAVLRGLHARRRDGAARPRDASLRPDEAGRAARSAHRQGGVRRRAAPHGRSRRTHVEHRRIPDAAAHSGAAARVPDCSPASRTPSSCASDRSTATRTSIRRRRSARTCRCATIR